MTFANAQTDFSKALLDPDLAVPANVTARTAAPDQRFAIYRNNVIAGLVNALRARFPAVEKIVGVDYFSALARVFVSGHPPRSPMLIEYGDDFVDFMDRFEPLRDLAYLSDVARIESARVRAYHAPDEEPCVPGILRDMAPEALYGARFGISASVRIVRSEHPVMTIWAMNSGESPVAEIENWTPENAMVSRMGDEVVVREIGKGVAALLAALIAQRTLSEALAAALAAEPSLDASGAVADLFRGGLVTSIRAGDEK